MVAILPMMEQTPVYNAINFSLPMLEIGFVNPVATGGTANSTAGLLSLASLLCPSESITHSISYGGDWGQSNYAGNFGGPGTISSCNGIIIPARGDIFVSSPNLGPVSIASVTDGTSNTALFSEHLLGYGSALDGLSGGYVSPAVAGTQIAKRALFQISSIAPKPDQGALGVAIAQQLVAACRSIPGGHCPGGRRRHRQLVALHPGLRYAQRLYTHTVTPNGYSCTGAESGFFGGQGNFTSDGSGGGWIGFTAASSNHPGGVNVGFGYGSVKFIKDSVSVITWWGLGTRNQGEVISADSVLITRAREQDQVRHRGPFSGSRPALLIVIAAGAVVFQENHVNRTARSMIGLAAISWFGTGCDSSSSPPAPKPGQPVVAGPNSRIKFKDEYKKMIGKDCKTLWKPSESKKKLDGIE